MKMIWHKAPGQYIAIWQNVFPYFGKKKQVILLLKKHPSGIVTSVVQMIKVVFLKLHGI